MKFSVVCQKQFPYFDKVDEIIIPVKSDKTIKKISYFCNKYTSAAVILNLNACVDTDTDIASIVEIIETMIKSTKYNIKICFSYQYKDIFYNPAIPFFFTEPATTYEELHTFLKFKPYSVRISNLLSYDLERVKRFCDKQDCGIRIIPDVAQSSYDQLVDLKKFFVRPEDIDEYENLITYCEFGYNRKVPAKMSYESYAIDKKWYGNLKELIDNFETDIDSFTLPSVFTINKMSCQQNCLRGDGCRSCGICNEYSKVASQYDKISKEHDLSKIKDKLAEYKQKAEEKINP